MAEKFLLEVNSLNNAWSFHHSGMFIDAAGNIYTYNFGKIGKETMGWNTKQRFEHAVNIGQLTPENYLELLELVNAVINLDKTRKIKLEESPRGADMGQVTNILHLPTHSITLETVGNVFKKSKNQAIQDLSRLLTTIHQEVEDAHLTEDKDEEENKEEK